MSDSEDVSLVSSNGTLEAFDFDQTLQILKDAAQDAADTKDYLLYSAVVDYHISEPARFTVEQRELVLQQLLDCFNQSHELVHEVGWDMPALLIPFVDSEFQFDGPIRSAPGVYKVLKIFEVLALYGNAKELFLKLTELLSTLKAGGKGQDAALAAKFYEIKLYCIFELIDSSMRRINTLYPSRFLAMAVLSFVNSLCINPIDDLTQFAFVMKRMFVFARNYVPPPKPGKVEVPADELQKIDDDEQFLQRKLLTALVTEGVHMALREEYLGYTPTLDFVLNIPVMTRLKELALSFDLDPQRDFELFLVLSAKLLDFEAAQDSDDDTFSSELFETLVVDFQRVFARCIVNAETGSVSDSLGGNLLLYTYEVSSENAPEEIDITLQQAFSMAIRVIVPGIVHKALYHKSLVDMAVFWCWYTVQRLAKRPRALELELSSVPRVVLSTFLQALLFAVVSLSATSQFRYTTLTLLTKILSSAPEHVAYTFINNALHECPFKGAKPVLVGVLRVLIVSDKKVDELSDKMCSLDVNGSRPDRKAPPPLPLRTLEEKTKYITLTKSRADEILSLVDLHIQLTFGRVNDAPHVNFEHLSTLLGLLNLLIPLRQSSVVDTKRVAAIIEATDKHIAAVETSLKGDEEKSVPLNAVTVLRVALARLAE
ncbi:hypothetical protein HF325_000270 [Metschnikowia pulcherrima]|uniref:Uncharacterized protein n=1 Tax=Metschnikowia pulcherrima TaxID=27326 RepID=A0A8H7LEG3_9ASCO|nr:hypothetical protein HF325_000270 [Metschnikowia pulcherrima]